LEDNVKINIKEIDWEVVEWIHLAQVRNQWRALVNIVMYKALSSLQFLLFLLLLLGDNNLLHGVKKYNTIFILKNHHIKGANKYFENL
jgi:hypothetical protein